jgi:hypothetical protein
MHFFDTLRHEIACGVRGAQHRSTKHSRFVTCPACVSLAREREEAAGRNAVQ